MACSSATFGGGAWRGAFFNCALATNSNFGHGGVAAFGGGGANGSVLKNCMVTGNYARDAGGGALGCIVINCTLAGNSTGGNGGGAYSGSLFNCLVYGNSATNGGGMYMGNASILVDSTVVGNVAFSAGGGVAGSGTMNNCITYYNNAPSGSNSSGIKMNNCCTVPIFSFSNSFTNEPALVNLAAGNFHLQSNSPCINSGFNGYVTTSADLDGNSRVTGGTVDMGVYEFQNPGPVIFHAWLQQFGLPTDGSADYADSDGDGMNNWNEWNAGTNPTNVVSVLKMLMPLPSTNPPGLTVSWPSVVGITYTLQTSTNPAGQPAFSILRSNLLSSGTVISFTDTNAISPGPIFYRVRVQ